MKKLYFLLLTTLISFASFGQTTVFQESFESGTSGTPSITCNDGSYDFFTITDGSDIGSGYSVSNPNGSYFFAAQDTDATECGATNPTLTFTGIDISSYTNLTFAMLVAEDDDGSNQDWDADTSVLVEINIDGSGYTSILQFSGGGATNTEPGLDTNFDGIADSTLLSDDFSEFTVSINSGSSADLRITFNNLNAGDEDIAIDNLRIIDGYVSCGVTLGTETYTCNASTTGTTDGVTINIPYTGIDASITSVTTSSTGTVAGDNPATTTNGTITITGLAEGDSWNITLNGGVCDGTTISGTVGPTECLPSTCFDLTGANEFEIVQISANDEADNWFLSSGEYYINGYCPSCTEDATDSWLVFGPLDMSSASNVELVFNSAEGFSGSDLQIFYTDAYNGCPDASLTTWTTISTIASGGSGSHNFPIASTGTETYIGIQYSDSDGTYSSWTLSNIGIYGSACPTLGAVTASDCNTLSTTQNQIEGFDMYPNPTNLGYVTILSANNTKMEVSVFDLLGKQVLNNTVKNNKLDVSNLKSGVYVMKVNQNDAISTKKLVIK
ncbi:T9SS type A sorting domain-containing protein [Neotamlana sedimentorum]|uniref:T9SS type A sorting domain-containing protein n=1 Tax=Neotamlana sedimentorum TaxID=1435349 RepID=UPI00069B0663|nr:T9SS type A sorting domain-containing protein [Tamlana sedimentorum]